MSRRPMGRNERRFRRIHFKQEEPVVEVAEAPVAKKVAAKKKATPMGAAKKKAPAKKK